MTEQATHDEHGEFGADYWEARYRSGVPTSRHGPTPSLVDETGELEPGTALDAGCGRGEDAIWLAARGWRVTAVDVSATALAQAEEAARVAGPDLADRIAWVQADLTDWSPGDRRFDLVMSHYVHLPGTTEGMFARLATWVAPGGTLLVVGHDGHGPSEDHGHAHPPGALVRTAQITAELDRDEWEIVVAQTRTRTVHRPDGNADSLRDAVVRARRV